MRRRATAPATRPRPKSKPPPETGALGPDDKAQLAPPGPLMPAIPVIVHVPPEHEMPPETDALNIPDSDSTHEMTSPSLMTGMYCGPRPLPKSQKSAPVTDEHVLVQPPVHPALAVASHEKFACTLQLPLQLAWHWALQLAIGAIPLQLTSHSLVQLAMHWLSHDEFDPIDEHWLLQLPMHSVEQLPEQLKLPGLPVHCPMHVPSQPPVQLALAEPEHIA